MPPPPLHNYTRILAPMDGLITSRKAEVGTTLSPGTPIFQMVDLDTVWVAAWIDASQIAQLKEGQAAAIRLRSGRQYQGQVARITTEADTVTRELEVDVKFAKLPAPLVIGEEAEVDINTGSHTALGIPLSALMSQNAHKGVLVADKGRVRFQKVTLGLNDGKQTAVLTGLKEGELVIVNPAGLAPGKKIRPELQSVPAQGN